MQQFFTVVPSQQYFISREHVETNSHKTENRDQYNIGRVYKSRGVVQRLSNNTKLVLCYLIRSLSVCH